MRKLYEIDNVLEKNNIYSCVSIKIDDIIKTDNKEFYKRMAVYFILKKQICVVTGGNQEGDKR